MRKQSHFWGKLFNKAHNKNVEVKIDLVEYEDDSIHYVYSPAFDLIGYGYSQEEARQSWELVLQEYFTYTLNKNTLIKDLQSRGWIVRKGNKYFTPPTFSWLLKNNHDLTEVYDKHNFQKSSKPITVPLADYS